MRGRRQARLRRRAPRACSVLTTSRSFGHVCYLGPPVGLKRLLFLVVVAAAMSLGLASSAPAGNFDEQRMGCSGEDPATCPTGTEGVPYSIPIELLPATRTRACAVLHGPPRAGPSRPDSPASAPTARASAARRPRPARTTSILTVDVRPGRRPARSRTRRTIASSSTSTLGSPSSRSGPSRRPRARSGAPYSLQMTATVPDAKTWTISSGTLPPGVALDAEHRPDLRHADGCGPVRLPGAREDERRRAATPRASRSSSATRSRSPDRIRSPQRGGRPAR